MLNAERSLAAATAFASRFGWAVFPADGDNGKKPLVQRGVNAATRCVEVIDRLWPKQPCDVAERTRNRGSRQRAADARFQQQDRKDPDAQHGSERKTSRLGLEGNVDGEQAKVATPLVIPTLD